MCWLPLLRPLSLCRPQGYLPEWLAGCCRRQHGSPDVPRSIGDRRPSAQARGLPGFPRILPAGTRAHRIPCSILYQRLRFAGRLHCVTCVVPLVSSSAALPCGCRAQGRAAHQQRLPAYGSDLTRRGQVRHLLVRAHRRRRRGWCVTLPCTLHTPHSACSSQPCALLCRVFCLTHTNA